MTEDAQTICAAPGAGRGRRLEPTLVLAFFISVMVHAALAAVFTASWFRPARIELVSGSGNVELSLAAHEGRERPAEPAVSRHDISTPLPDLPEDPAAPEPSPVAEALRTPMPLMEALVVSLPEGTLPPLLPSLTPAAREAFEMPAPGAGPVVAGAVHVRAEKQVAGLQPTGDTAASTTGATVVGKQTDNTVSSSGRAGGVGASSARPASRGNRLPEYPPIARQRGWEGMTLLRIEVLADGSTGSIQVLETAGHEELDQAAIKAARGWRFTAAQLDGKAVSSFIEQPVAFKLH